MNHEFKEIRIRARDLSKVKCLLCNKTFTYSTRSLKPIEEQLKSNDLICQGKKDKSL